MKHKLKINQNMPYLYNVLLAPTANLYKAFKPTFKALSKLKEALKPRLKSSRNKNWNRQ